MDVARRVGERGEQGKLLACLEIGKVLTSTLDLPEVLRLIMHQGSQIIVADNWSLLLRDPATGELTFAVAVGLDPSLVRGLRLPRGKGFVGHVAETGAPLFIPDVTVDSRFNPEVDRITGFTTRSIICLPLVAREEVLGVLEIVNVEDVRLFESAEAPFLRILVDYAAIAIENSRYVTRIEELVLTDEYTGLPNARYLHRTLEDLVGRASRTGEPLSVAFADLDNFKDIVDRLGHLMGSQVLREVGATMRGVLSPSDELVKYGGDEFVILLPGRGKGEALRAVEQVRRAVASARYLRPESHQVAVTASFGVATYPQDAATEKELLLRADNAMYIAKRTKNTIAAAEEPPLPRPEPTQPPDPAP